jgi:hypothetical protein
MLGVTTPSGALHRFAVNRVVSGVSYDSVSPNTIVLYESR